VDGEADGAEGELAGRPPPGEAQPARQNASDRHRAAIAVVVLASVSLAVASSPARSMAAAGWLTAPSPLLGYVGHGAADPRLHHARRPPDLSVRGSTDELVWGYRYDRFVYALMTGHADSVPTALDAATDRMDLKESADLGRSLEILPLDRRVRALAACRVGYLLSYDPLDDPGLLPGPVLDDLSRPPARLYRVRAVVPRLRIVARARPLHRDADLAAALSDPAYDPGRAVLLEDAAGGAPADDDEAGGTAAGGEAAITQETPERITMRLSTTGPGYAVLADAYAPGWRATLDDRPVPILRADGLFRAVALPAGEHTVVMEYRPADVVAGLVLGFVGVLLVTLYGVAARSRAW